MKQDPRFIKRRTFKQIYKKLLVRPIIYKAFSRFILSLTAALLWDRFINADGIRDLRAFAFVFFGIFFFVAAWLCYLRMDGFKIPRLKSPKWERKLTRSYGDIPDYVDEPIVSFDELEDDERDFCSMVANIIVGIVYMGISLL